MRTVVKTHCLAAMVAAFAAMPAWAGETAKPHWTYEGAHGPDHWAELAGEFAQCGAGAAQSPVDIRTGDVTAGASTPLIAGYQPSPLHIVNNGHTIEVEYAPGSALLLGGERYELKQFHFHAPSENAIDGHHAAMEAHFVHANAAGGLAVIAVMMEAGADNPALARLWAHLPDAAQGSFASAEVRVNAGDLMPQQRAAYSFTGSLTTPPCSEGVSWFVLKEPVFVGAGQVAAFLNAVGWNARPLQPLNARAITSIGGK
ncbi:MAG: carbonic anhydrase [Pseudomonadota bacterium]